MLEEQYARLNSLIGEGKLRKLQNSKVAVFGVGGVGGYVVEVLARSGIGRIDVVDNDVVCMSNINRQVIALHSTVGMYKVDVVEQRIHDINPNCEVNKFKMFYLKDNADEIDLSVYDYVIDCIDTVSAKIEIIRRCKELNVPVLCSMGTANKMNPMAFKIVDISKTQNDPLARVLRKKLRKLDICSVDVLFSDELPVKVSELHDTNTMVASNAYVPAAAGILIGGEVVNRLIAL